MALPWVVLTEIFFELWHKCLCLVNLPNLLISLCFLVPDQIDENLKLALEQDLNTMAPGLTIQVLPITCLLYSCVGDGKRLKQNTAREGRKW